MSRTVYPRIVFSKIGSLPYTLNIRHVFYQLRVTGTATVINDTSQTKTNIAVHVGVYIGNKQIIMTTTIASMTPNSTRTVTVNATVNDPTYGASISNIDLGDYASYQGTYIRSRSFQTAEFTLMVNLPTSGDTISHSGLSTFTEFLTLQTDSHTTTNAILYASETNRPQGISGTIKLSGGSTVTTITALGTAGNSITVNYVDTPYNSYYNRTIT